MQEKTTATRTEKYGIQEYLSLGYIYLIILGIVGDVIYYKFLGINILNYSGISDVLMAPINTLVYDIRVLLLMVAALAVGYFVYNKMILKNGPAESGGNKKIETVLIFLPLLLAGLKIGSGASTKGRMERGELKMNHVIIFNDNVSKNVRIIGQNSSYIFYLPEGQKKISILPISGNVKEIKMLKEQS